MDTCRNCKYAIGRQAPDGTVNYIECRKNPPIVITELDGYNWPVIKINSWCGEFKKYRMSLLDKIKKWYNRKNFQEFARS